MTNVDDIKQAIQYVDNSDRDLWVRMGAALKTELGEAGFDIFNDWSQTAANYDPNSAKSVWKSLKPGFVNINSLFYEARQEGYRPNAPFKPLNVEELKERERAAEEARLLAEKERQDEMAKAKEEAQNKYSSLSPIRDINHDYLVNKGINERSLLRQVRREQDNLIIPMKKNGEIVGLQSINKTGRKSFTKGMELKGASLVLGSWANREKGIVLTEGYATAASIHKATGLTTIVCFAGFNLKEVAERLPKDLDVPIIIASDNDEINKKTGKRPGYEFAIAAKEVLGDKATVIEPNFTKDDFEKFDNLYGTRPSDFNDLHKLHGLDAVNQQLSPKETTMVSNRENELMQEPPLSKEEVENSIAPAIDKIIEQRAAYMNQSKEVEAEVITPKKEEEKSQPEVKAKPESQRDEELVTEKQPELKAEETEKERIDVEKELSKPIVIDHDYDHPPGHLKSKYFFTEKGDYINEAGDVFFKDQGASLKTAKNDMDTVQDMLEVAETKGWSSIQLNGSKEFKRIAYIEATVRGIEAYGYTPNEKDLAIIDQLREERSINIINKTDKPTPETSKSDKEPEPEQGQAEGEEKVYDQDGNFSHQQVVREQERTEEPEVPLAQQEAEKDKLLNQNRAPDDAVIEDSKRVDAHGADIPMAGVGGQEIRDELQAFMNGLTPKQQGLNKSSMFILKTAKTAVQSIISGLDKEQRDTAIRNFNEKIDSSINGDRLDLGFSSTKEQPAPVLAKEQEHEKEEELER